MPQPWIKVWQEKILSSMNLRRCNFTAHALFLEYLIRVRPDGEHQGKLCFPDGAPISDEELWRDMKMKARDYRAAKRNLLILGVIKLNRNCIVLRKFSDLQLPTHEPITGQSRDKVGTTAGQAQGQPRDNHGTISTVPYITEEKRRDKDKDIYCPSVKADGQHTSIFDHWNTQAIITHNALTPKIERAINGCLKDGYTPDEIKTAISNYASILKNNNYYFKYQWTLKDFLQRGIDKFKDLKTAQNNYIRDKFPCPKCKGKGEIIKKDAAGNPYEASCPDCKGEKFIRRIDYISY